MKRGPVICGACLVLAVLSIPTQAQEAAQTPNLKWIHVSHDGTHFVNADSGRRVVLWGVNYDHDKDSRLLEDYWADRSWDVSPPMDVDSKFFFPKNMLDLNRQQTISTLPYQP